MNPMLRIAGIDFSLRSPAMCVLSRDTGAPHKTVVEFFFVKQRAKPDVEKTFLFQNGAKKDIQVVLRPFSGCKESGFVRQVWAANTVAGWVAQHPPDRVYLEGYAYSKHFGNQTMMEAGGMLKMALHLKGVEVTTVTPTMGKKLLTGSGKASKKQMISQLNTEYGIDLLSLLEQGKIKDLHPAEDLADAFAMCLAHPEIKTLFSTVSGP